MNSIVSALPGKIVSLFGKLDSPFLNGGQQLAVKYFSVATVLFFAQLLFGLLAAIQFVAPGFLFGWLDFSVNRMIHILSLIHI